LLFHDRTQQLPRCRPGIDFNLANGPTPSPPTPQSVQAFHQVTAICAALLAAGGIAGAIGIVNRRNPSDAEGCAGGQLFGAPRPAVASVGGT
jgi:hypothetical protein